jgi:hypothetical protein
VPNDDGTPGGLTRRPSSTESYMAGQQDSVHEVVRKTAEPVGWVLAPILIFVVLLFVAMGAYFIHVVLGLVASVLIILSGCAALIGFRQHSVEHARRPPVFVGALFISVLALAIAGFGSLSYGLKIVKLAEYDFNGSPTIWSFVQHYGWHFVDMIPSMKIWETLSVDDPLPPQDIAARSCIMLFRILIVLPFIGLVKSWLQLRKKRSDHSSEAAE